MSFPRAQRTLMEEGDKDRRPGPGQYTLRKDLVDDDVRVCVMTYTGTHCSKLQHTATHCIVLQCAALQHIARGSC